MSEAAMSLMMLAIFLIALALGVPIAFALGGAAALSVVLFIGPHYLGAMMATSVSLQLNWVLVATPLFIVMAMVLDKAGIIADLFETAYKWSGPLRGGLAVAVVLSCTVFAACTGIVAGAIVAMGIIALPIMMRYNYNKDIALGSILAGGTLGQLIPPSCMIILYGAVTGVSVGKMFAAAFVCGPILSTLYISYILIRAFLRKDLCPALLPEDRASWREKFRSLSLVILPILLILLVMGSIFSGAATPTEAAAVGALGAVVCAAVRHRLNWLCIKDAAIGTIKMCGMIGWILLGSLFFASVFSAIGGSALVEDLIMMVPGGTFGALITMLIVLLIMGMIMDVVAIVVIAGPLFSPIVLHLGLDPVWFGLLFMVMLQMGYISPPFGWSLFFLAGVAPKPITMSNIYRGSWAFLGLQAIGVIIFVAFPAVVLWLPNIIVPAG